MTPSRRPEDADKVDDPKDCPYHRIISHTIKDWLQKQINEGNLVLPDEPKQVNVVSTIPQPSSSDSATKSRNDGQWETVDNPGSIKWLAKQALSRAHYFANKKQTSPKLPKSHPLPRQREGIGRIRSTFPTKKQSFNRQGK